MKQSEIWLVSLDPTLGAEIRKTRPVIVVNNDIIGKLPLKIVVPITDWKPNYAIAPWMVYIQPNIYNNLTKESSADCFQVRSIAEQRFIRKIGDMKTADMNKLRIALSVVLDMS